MYFEWKKRKKKHKKKIFMSGEGKMITGKLVFITISSNYDVLGI